MGGMDFHIRSLLDLQQYHDPERVAERLGISPESWPLFGQVWPSSQVLASLVVHRRGGDITASDYHPLSPEFLGENLRLNDLGSLKYLAADWGVLDDDLGVFDLIIGSDLIYEHGQPALLAAYIDRHSAELVEVLIVDPNRPNRSSFCREMAELEYEGNRTRADCILGNGDVYKGSLLHFQRNDAQFDH